MTQIPEGRKPMQSDDMAKLHPSTWAEECRWQTIRAQQAIDEAKALRARVETLEYALRAIAGFEAWPDNLMGDKDIARAALQQEGGE